jgi:uncharacterized membrane protein YfcA
MDLTMLMIAGLGLFLAGVVKGATGLGYSSCALPFLVASIGLKPAMGLILVPAMATNLSVAFTAGHFAEIARRFARLYAAILPGIAVGIYMLIWIAQSLAVRTLGVIIILYSLATLIRPQFAISKPAERFLQVPTGFANGVLTGLTGSQVMPLFPYMMSLDLDPARLVQAINLAVTVATVFLGIGLFSTGILSSSLLAASIVAILPAVAGVEIGNRLRGHIPAAQFRSVALYVLLASGILLLVRS